MGEIFKALKLPRLVGRAALPVLIAVAASTASAADFSAIWLDGDGNWSDATQWDTNPNYPHNANGVTYNATINSGSARLDRDIRIQRFFFNGGELNGPSDLTLNKGLTWTGGDLLISGAINFAAGSTSTISGMDLTLSGSTINNSGKVNQRSKIQSSGAVINNLAGATWNAQPGAILGDPGSEQFVFNNSGTFLVRPAGALVGAVFNNSGNVTIKSSTSPGNSLTLRGGGSTSGSFNVGANSKLIFFPSPTGDTTNTLASGAMLTGAGAIENYTSIIVAGNSTISTSFLNIGDVTVQLGATLTLTGGYYGRERGGLYLAGGTVTSAQTLHIVHSSSLSGSGIVNGNVDFSRGNIIPGDHGTAGRLAINGNVYFDFADTYAFTDIGGLTQGTEYDYIEVNGTMQIGGLLFLTMSNGFELQLSANQIFTILTSNSAISGTFANVANGARLTTTDGLASFQVNYGAGSPFGADNLVLSDPIRIVPEPSSGILLAAGGVLIGFARLRRPAIKRD